MKSDQNKSPKDVFSTQKSLFDNAVFKDVFSTKKILFNNSAFKDIFSTQKSLFDNPAFKDAFTMQKSLFDNPAFKDIFSTHKNLFDNAAFKDVFSAQKSLFDNPTFKNVLSIQKSLMNEDFSQQISSTYKNIIDSYKTLDSSKIFEMINKYNFANDEIKGISVDGNSLVIENQNYELDELRKLVSSIIDKSGVNVYGTVIPSSLDKIFQQISDIKNSNIRSIIYNTIITIIITALSIIYSPKLIELSEHYFNSNKKESIKKMEKITDVVPAQIKAYLKQCRFVSIKILDVRTKPFQKSPIIGKLYFGQIVSIIHKKKNWSLVELIDLENEVSIRGWVFTRYVINFK